MPEKPPLAQPADAAPLPPDEFDRWYGGWQPLNPETIAEFMHGFERPWWVIGGWAIEKFTGVGRAHEDMDISILSTDAEEFRLFLGDRWTPWNQDQGWFRPFDHRFRDIRPTSSIWVREHSRAPWILDVPLTPTVHGEWTNKRLRKHTAPLDEVTWVAEDGIRYLNPEVALLMKHAQTRPKDRADAEVVLPLLDDARRTWLRDALVRIDPKHPWLTADGSDLPRREDAGG